VSLFQYAAKYPEIVLQAAGAEFLVYNIRIVREEITSRSKQQHSYTCVYFLHDTPFSFPCPDMYNNTIDKGLYGTVPSTRYMVNDLTGIIFPAGQAETSC